MDCGTTTVPCNLRILPKQKTELHYSELPVITQHSEGESLQSCNFEGIQGVERRRKSLNLNGGRGRNRTYNLSVKSRMLCQLSYASRLD
jgi:hypothetical protein